MRILVTGASGFLGHYLSSTLHKRGDFVVDLVRDGLGPEVTPITVFGGFAEVERAIAEYEIDTVVHLAAQTQVSTAVHDPIGSFEANTNGTIKVLEACRRQRVSRIVVASTDKVYGTGSTPYVEELPIRPCGVYSASKACADLIAQAYIDEYRMPIVITRCGNLYGPGHLNWTTLIPGTIRSVLRNERPKLRSNGGPRRDFLFVEDAVDGYLKLIDSDVGGAFNFGTGVGLSVMDVVNAILKGMDSKLEPVINDKIAGSGGVEIQNQYLSYAKAKRILGWKPQHSLEQGLAKTIAWYRERYQ